MSAEKEHALGEYLEEFLEEMHEHLEDIEIETLRMESGTSKESIHKIFRKFHTIKGMAGFMGFKTINTIAHETETLIVKCKTGELEIDSNVLDYLFKSVEYIKDICDNRNLETDSKFQKNIGIFLLDMGRNQEKRLGEILLEQESIKKDDLDYLLKKQRELNYNCKFGELALKEKKVKASDVSLALRKQKKTYSTVAKGDVIGDILNNFSIINEKVNLKDKSSDENFNIFNEINSYIDEVKNSIINIDRIKSARFVKKIKRIVELIIKNTNKSICLNIKTDRFYIDNRVEKKLKEIILHIVRNSISHGIEDIETREKAGKSKTGKIEIEARKISESLVIEFEDDGKGIDENEILKKAVEKKILEKNFEYSSETILYTIFEPGFSTSKNIDDVSGRGVGMNIIKEETEEIGGEVLLENHYPLGFKVRLIFRNFFNNNDK